METSVKPYNVYLKSCPTRQVLDCIADKWTVLVMGELEEQPKRFSAIQRKIEGVSQKMLTQTLRELERDGLVSRTVFPEVPPRVEYALTPLGRTLCEPIAAIRNWAEQNIPEIISAQTSYDAREGALRL